LKIRKRDFDVINVIFVVAVDTVAVNQRDSRIDGRAAVAAAVAVVDAVVVAAVVDVAVGAAAVDDDDDGRFVVVTNLVGIVAAVEVVPAPVATVLAVVSTDPAFVANRYVFVHRSADVGGID